MNGFSENQSKSTLAVIGSINIDHVLRLERFAKPGETMHAQSYRIIAGGKGANQAVAAARLGLHVRFLGCIGDDALGQELKKDFEKDGLQTENILEQKDTPTGVAMIQVNGEGENSIGIYPGANALLSKDLIHTHADLILASSMLLIQLETPLESVSEAINIAHKHGIKVVLNPAPAKMLSDDLLSKVDIITPNETEAEILTDVKVIDEASALEAAKVLFKKGVRILIITLGAQGTYLIQKDQKLVHVPAFLVRAIDTTAAGDTFNAAFCTHLLAHAGDENNQQQDKKNHHPSQESLKKALEFASAAAALSVTKEGAQSSIPSLHEVNNFLTQHT